MTLSKKRKGRGEKNRRGKRETELVREGREDVVVWGAAFVSESPSK